MKLFTKSEASNARLGVFERLSYASGNFGTGFTSQVISAFLLYYYTNYLGLNAGIVGVIFMIVRVTDGFTDLIMGNIVDRTKSKYGRARAWILRMCIPYALTSVLVFTVPATAPQAVQYIYIFVVYLLDTAIIATALAVPYFTLSALLTDDPYERGILGVFSMFSGTFAGMVVSATALKMVEFFGDDSRAWIFAEIIFAAAGLVFQLICFLGTKERVTPAVSDSDLNNQSKKKEGNVKESVISLLKNK